MTLKERLAEDLKTAMKNKDIIEKLTLEEKAGLCEGKDVCINVISKS